MKKKKSVFKVKLSILVILFQLIVVEINDLNGDLPDTATVSGVKLTLYNYEPKL